MADRQNENSRLMDYPGGRKYSADEKRNGEAGTVVQLRDWLDDPYEQVRLCHFSFFTRSIFIPYVTVMIKMFVTL